MLYSITGKLIEKTTDAAVLCAGGVAYELAIPSTAAGTLPPLGQEATLYTYLSVNMNAKDDVLELFGFTDLTQRRCFKLLISVSGIGPKAALGILSYLTPDSILLAIAAGDHKAFTKCPGVGPKLAQRLILELKDKAGKAAGFSGSVDAAALSAAAVPDGAGQQAVMALVNLGYSQSQASAAVAAQDQSLPAGELIRGALKSMASGR